MAEVPKILPRKVRSTLGSLTVSPEMHSLRVSEDRSRQKRQPPATAPALWGSGKNCSCHSLVFGEEDRLVLLSGDFFLMFRCLCLHVLGNCLLMKCLKEFKRKLLHLSFHSPRQGYGKGSRALVFHFSFSL